MKTSTWYQTKLRERQLDTFQSEYPTQMTNENAKEQVLDVYRNSCCCAEHPEPHDPHTCEHGLQQLTRMAYESIQRTDHTSPNQTHGFPSHLESNPIILRARIAKANDRINSMIDTCAVESGYTKHPGELAFSYREVWDMLREIQTIIGGL